MEEQAREIRRLRSACREYEEEKQEGVKLLVEKFSGKLTLSEIKEIALYFSAPHFLGEEVAMFLHKT